MTATTMTNANSPKTTILDLPPELIHQILLNLDADHLRDIDPALFSFISLPEFKYIGFDYLFYIDLSHPISIGFEIYLEKRVSLLQRQQTQLLHAIAHRQNLGIKPFGKKDSKIDDGYMSRKKERHLKRAFKVETQNVFADFHGSWGEKRKAVSKRDVDGRDAIWVEMALDRLGEEFHGLMLGRERAEALRKEIGMFEERVVDV